MKLEVIDQIKDGATFLQLLDKKFHLNECGFRRVRIHACIEKDFIEDFE